MTQYHIRVPYVPHFPQLVAERAVTEYPTNLVRYFVEFKRFFYGYMGIPLKIKEIAINEEAFSVSVRSSGLILASQGIASLGLDTQAEFRDADPNQIGLPDSRLTDQIAIK